ncbi:MAG: hypothetical protein ABFD62_00160 [Syntrophaceae bacterium]
MQIESSNIIMAAAHNSVQRYSGKESLKTWVGDVRPDFEGRGNAGALSAARQDQLELSRAAVQKCIQNETRDSKDCDSVTVEPSEHDKITLKLLEKLFEELTGKKFNFKLVQGIETKAENSECPESQSSDQSPPDQQKAGWGLEYDLHEKYYESEQTSFEAGGVIRTSDGREINFSLELEMSREFASQNDVSIRAGDAVKVDPLVINFAAPAAQLTSEKFSFDLDADGTEDQISLLAAGSGFLSIDLNNDNVINDGSELFGPQAGNGFVQLAGYDVTGDNWIDESDPVFDSLRVWTKDGQGNDQLYSLGQIGVGAVYLGNIETPYSLKNGDNLLQGAIAQTGIALKEDGSVVTVQDIDISI